MNGLNGSGVGTRLRRLLIGGLVALCLIGSFASAQAAEGNWLPPGYREGKAGGTALYRWAKKSFFDVDKLLAEQLMIQFSSCEYISNLNRTVSRDKGGVGSCLYLLLMESFSSPHLAGMVRAHARPLGEKRAKETVMHIYWNPSNSWNNIWGNVLRLVGETFFPSWIKDKPDTLWGTLVFHFPKQNGFDLIPNDIVRSFIDTDGQPLEMFSISLYPVRNKDDAGVYQGLVSFFGKGATAEHPMYQIHFKTDFPARSDDHFVEVEGR